jgi:predicted transcriptional regulator
MSSNNYFVGSHMRLLPVYVEEDDTLFRAIESMKKFKIDAISVIRKDFSIAGCLTKKKIKEILGFRINLNILRNIKVKDIIDKNVFPLIAYPNMSIKEAFLVMQCLNNTYIPVVKAPWEKKVIGVLWLDDVLSAMKECRIKLPA